MRLEKNAQMWYTGFITVISMSVYNVQASLVFYFLLN